MHEQASTSVKHMALPCHWSQRTTVTGDLVRCYGALGRTIIFCDTKRDCNELTAALGEDMRARALHGDIPQQQREVRPPLPSVSLPSLQPSFLIWPITALCCTSTAVHPCQPAAAARGEDAPSIRLPPLPLADLPGFAQRSPVLH